MKYPNSQKAISSILLLAFCICLNYYSAAQAPNVKLVPVDSGWANTSVNVAIFRKNSLVTFRDTQFIAFYDPQRFMVLGKRKLGTATWHLRRSQYQGNTADAHNIISLIVDGDGYLHVAWDHHNQPLRYARSVEPGSLVLTAKLPMTGQQEDRVTYPEFYKLANGSLLFFYRDGQSGQGNMIINKYDVHTKKWSQLQQDLIDGENQRSAYWQACIDKKGTIHISWVWRETPDVASNHDICYARSMDGGLTWEKSTGEKYKLPITASTAEYACKIPQKSELINQTAMSSDALGHPYIVTYWREAVSNIPQFHVVYNDGVKWVTQDMGFRKTAFSLSGAGTLRIPVSRPQIIAWQHGKTFAAAMIFRDDDRGGKVSVAFNRDLSYGIWKLMDITNFSLGSWEPSFDTELWKEKEILHLFVQKAEQANNEKQVQLGPQMIQVLEWDPKKY